MPKNESENAILPDGASAPEAAGAEAAQTENAWVEFERGRVSRRQALKKLGMTSAMAAFALFSVDDLARMVGKAMQQRAADNKVVEQIAREFQSAGIAMADGSNGSCGQSGSVSTCQHCSNQLILDDCYCDQTYDSDGKTPDPTLWQHCHNQAIYNFYWCWTCWCTNGPVVHNNTCPGYSSLQPPQGCNC